MKNKKNILLLYFVVISNNALAELYSACLTPNKEMGKCIETSSCPTLHAAVHSKNETAINSHQICGSHGRILYVCCKINDYLELHSSVRKQRDLAHFQRKTPIQRYNPNAQPIITNALPDTTVCGLHTEEGRIYGGSEVMFGEFPWMVVLEYTNKKIRCSGTLINSRYVLTAAHCIIDQLTNVRLGEWDLESDPDCISNVAQDHCAPNVLKVDIEEKIPHPYYISFYSNDDIGLLKLAQEITFSEYIGPICLPTANIPAADYNDFLTIAGWGISDNGRLSNILLKAEVPLMKNENCQKQLISRSINSYQLCAGSELGIDSCKGDSGGPLMRKYTDSTTTADNWYQEGVISFGNGCARLNSPAVYTRIDRYINWIIEKIN